MQTLRSLQRDLPNVSASTTSGPPVPSRRFSLNPRQSTLPARNNIRKPFLFAQHPDQGPAVESLNYSNPQEPPSKRCELALDDSLYLPKTDDRNFYGRFITLGYHHTAGPLNDPLRSRSDRNKTFDLWKRVKPNGWKFIVDANSGLRATTVLDSSTRDRLRVMSLNTPFQERSSSIRVTSLDRPDRFVEYTLLPSEDHDLFQFGRDQYNNDFHLPGHIIEGHTWDPISRLAFRVQCSRSTPGEIRIAAAGFDHANELFLGPNALRWSTQADGGTVGAVDGGITVGLYLWKPKPVVQEGDTTTGDWYEVSALGEVYHLRVAGKRGHKVIGVNNLLTEGCIVVNANSVLLFTTVPPSKDTTEYLSAETLSARLDEIKNTLCPITYDHIPLRTAMISNAGIQPRNAPIPPFLLDLTVPQDISTQLERAGVFPICGHVFQLPPPHLNIRLTTCPKCRTVGRMIPLVLQTAPTFFPVDAEFTHVLPCGHAVSLELGKRMASVPLPTNELLLGDTEAKTWGFCLAGRKRRCWFCGTGFYSTELKKLYFEQEEEEKQDEVKE